MRSDCAGFNIYLDASTCGGFHIRLKGGRVNSIRYRLVKNEGRAAFLQASYRLFDRAHERLSFDALKPIIYEPIAKRVRRVLKARRRGKGIGAVQFLALLALGAGKPEHPPQ